jgi:hypothetical protein
MSAGRGRGGWAARRGKRRPCCRVRRLHRGEAGPSQSRPPAPVQSPAAPQQVKVVHVTLHFYRIGEIPCDTFITSFLDARRSGVTKTSEKINCLKSLKFKIFGKREYKRLFSFFCTYFYSTLLHSRP